MQTWLSQNVSPESLAELPSAANHASCSPPDGAPKASPDGSEFDGDVLIGDFFFHPETEPLHFMATSDDDSHTHVESKGSDSHSAHLKIRDQDTISDLAPDSSMQNPAPADTKLSSPHQFIISSKRTYEPRTPTPESSGEFMIAEETPSVKVPARSYSPRPPTPEELSDFNTIMALAKATPLQVDSSSSSNKSQADVSVSCEVKDNSSFPEVTLHETDSTESLDSPGLLLEGTLDNSFSHLDASLDLNLPTSEETEQGSLPEIMRRFCFDTPVGPRKLVWHKEIQPLEAASTFCSKYGITNPLYSKALAWYLTNSCK